MATFRWKIAPRHRQQTTSVFTASGNTLIPKRKVRCRALRVRSLTAAGFTAHRLQKIGKMNSCFSSLLMQDMGHGFRPRPVPMVLS